MLAHRRGRLTAHGAEAAHLTPLHGSAFTKKLLVGRRRARFSAPESTWELVHSSSALKLQQTYWATFMSPMRPIGKDIGENLNQSIVPIVFTSETRCSYSGDIHGCSQDLDSWAALGAWDAIAAAGGKNLLDVAK